MALDKNGIAQRIAQELKDGYYVNLGIGIPTLVANYIPNHIARASIYNALPLESAQLLVDVMQKFEQTL